EEGGAGRREEVGHVLSQHGGDVRGCGDDVHRGARQAHRRLPDGEKAGDHPGGDDPVAFHATTRSGCAPRRIRRACLTSAWNGAEVGSRGRARSTSITPATRPGPGVSSTMWSASVTASGMWWVTHST